MNSSYALLFLKEFPKDLSNAPLVFKYLELHLHRTTFNDSFQK